MSLAIECGATSSDVILVADNGNIQKHFRLGSANYQLMDDEQLEIFFHNIGDRLISLPVHSIGIGMPGIVDSTDVQVWKRFI